MFLTAFALCSLGLFKLQTEGQTLRRKEHLTVTKNKIVAQPGLP